MNRIKYLKEERIELNGIVYKPYKICNLPPSFGAYEEFESENGTVYKYPIISEWFNHKGYTYIAEQNMKNYIKYKNGIRIDMMGNYHGGCKKSKQLLQ